MHGSVPMVFIDSTPKKRTTSVSTFSGRIRPGENGQLCLVASQVTESSTSEPTLAVESAGLGLEGSITAGLRQSPGDRHALTCIGKDERVRPHSICDAFPRILPEHRRVVVENSVHRSLMTLQPRPPAERPRRLCPGHARIPPSRLGRRSLIPDRSGTPRSRPTQNGGKQQG